LGASLLTLLSQSNFSSRKPLCLGYLRQGSAEDAPAAIDSRVFIFSDLTASPGKCRKIREGSRKVRFWTRSGQRSLSSWMSAFDPKPTCVAPMIAFLGRLDHVASCLSQNSQIWPCHYAAHHISDRVGMPCIDNSWPSTGFRRNAKSRFAL